MGSTQESTLLNLTGVEFFKKLEEIVRVKIPSILQKVLLINDIDCALVLSRVNDDTLKRMELFMRDKFTGLMIEAPDQIENYLGKYSKCQDKFSFSDGQIIILKMIVEECAKAGNFGTPSTSASSIIPDSGVVNEKSNANEIFKEDDLIEQPKEFNDFSFFKYIGSLMITIFNDAKRLSISGWSWPSRHVASEKSQHFKLTGNIDFNPTLHYVVPAQYPTFLNSIVESDKPKFVNRLKDSLALSWRVDGSVDRTQDHNIYVIGHMVNKDASVSSVFMGFDVPKEGKAIGVFKCIKSVVTEILSWIVSLNLISSLVTDGEKLNLGNKNGIHVKFTDEIKLQSNGKKSILSIWCVAHRFNLAWTDLCKKFTVINDVISDASSLSTHFHKSGERTFKLKQVAAAARLSKPLRYPTYFPIRWTQYVFDLFNVTLRNWRAAMTYFISEKETGLESRWLVFDRIHVIAFLADILQLLKTFQKTFESDIVSLLDIPLKKQQLIEKLEKLFNEPMDDGWEKLFLSQVDEGNLLFCGHELTKTSAKRRSSNSFFDTRTRNSIIQSLIDLLNERLDYDADLQVALQPLASIKPTVTRSSLKSCYDIIVHDLDEHQFFVEYATAVNVLKNHQFKNALDTLQKLQFLMPNQLGVLKIALARVIAAKPHSADVESPFRSMDIDYCM